MGNMNTLIQIKSDADKNITELKRRVYQMYPAVSISDIELAISKINEAESSMNNAFKRAIANECNKNSQQSKNQTNRKIIGLVISL